MSNGVKCSECDETENGFLPNMCDAHTHGMDKYGHQEFQIVLMIGAELICYILNALGLRVQAGESFKDGDSVGEIIKDYDVRIKEVEVDGKKLLYCPMHRVASRKTFIAQSTTTSSIIRWKCFTLITISSIENRILT